MQNEKQVAVIGGGASGLIAAIFCKRTDPSCHVTVYERMDRVGKKILATGNGQCNLTNIYLALEKYHGASPEFVMSAFSAFGNQKTIEFFNEIGLLTRIEEDGRVYPYSYQASAVLDALRFECADLGVEIVCGCEVTALKRQCDGFQLQCGNRRYPIYADRVILCGGGRAGEHFGSNGSCYALLKQCGHTVSEQFPAIVQVNTQGTVTRQLKGIKVNAIASVLADGKKLRQETGEVLFTDYGLSGPPILQLSQIVSTHKAQSVEIVLNFMPEYPPDQVKQMLKQRASQLCARTMEHFFNGLINKKVGQTIVKQCNIPLCSHAGNLTAQDMNALCFALQNFSFTCMGTKGFSSAQVTAGGGVVTQFHSDTMESKSVGGLYACGELLDIHGDSGGYNLQWAWSSGACAGKACALSFTQRF